MAGSVSMTMEGDGDKELPDEDQVTGNRLVHEGENVIKDSVLNNETVNSVVEAGGVGGTLQAKGSQLQQSQGAAICWERFLHVTSIKVLLVENDNSTRHIVTALLRNCNYEVIEAANGLQAWKILENLTNQVDLVLSEVVMPCLSGVGLLCKIMSHKTRKNMPVIMMSSHDSVGIVIKCLSKGAADFLVKPIRKNELKNLWQHVWRRCLSSSGSGSGSESGTQTQKSVKPKISEQSDNNSGKNDGENILGNGALHDGIGSQSFSTKQAVEVDRSEAVSPCNQAPKCADSIHAQVICSNTETSARRSTKIMPSRYCQEEPDNTGKGKPTITGSLRDPEIEPENTTEVPFEDLGARHNSALELDSNTSSLKKDRKTGNAIGNCPPSEHNVVTPEMSHPQIDKRELNKVVDTLEINNTSADSKHCVVEQSLKRLRGLRESGMTFQDNRNVLRRSELSAFSRYNSSSNHTRTPKAVTQGSYSIEDCLKIAKKEPLHDIEAHMNKKLSNPRSNGVSNSRVMGSSTNLLTSKPLPLRNTVDSLHPSSSFKPVFIDRSSSQKTPKFEPGDVQTEDVLAPQSSDNIVIQHPHHHKHHHIYNLDQHCSSNHEDLSLKKHGMNGPDCGPSNVLAGSCEGNLEYHSSSKSASGSNHRYGQSKAINAECTNGNCKAGSAGPSRSGGDASSSGSGNTMDPFKLVRAAALTKFRQKRKERCFMKKVRYQTRKRLADKRPRVRGQFVRQIEQNSLSNSADG